MAMRKWGCLSPMAGCNVVDMTDVLTSEHGLFGPSEGNPTRAGTRSTSPPSPSRSLTYRSGQISEQTIGQTDSEWTDGLEAHLADHARQMGAVVTGPITVVDTGRPLDEHELSRQHQQNVELAMQQQSLGGFDQMRRHQAAESGLVSGATWVPFAYHRQSKSEEHYEELLEMALADGWLDVSERIRLEGARAKHGISMRKHYELLAKVTGLEGFYRSESVEQYRELLRMAMADGWLSWGEDQRLAEARSKYGISYGEHYALMAEVCEGMGIGTAEQAQGQLREREHSPLRSPASPGVDNRFAVELDERMQRALQQNNFEEARRLLQEKERLSQQQNQYQHQPAQQQRHSSQHQASAASDPWSAPRERDPWSAGRNSSPRSPWDQPAAATDRYGARPQLRPQLQSRQQYPYQHQHSPNSWERDRRERERRLRDAFKRADRNGDGVVNKPEIVVQLQEDRELCELLGLPSDTSYDDPGFARMFREADVNNDRVLTFEEFVTICDRVGRRGHQSPRSDSHNNNNNGSGRGRSSSPRGGRRSSPFEEPSRTHRHKFESPPRGGGNGRSDYWGQGRSGGGGGGSGSRGVGRRWEQQQQQQDAGNGNGDGNAWSDQARKKKGHAVSGGGQRYGRGGEGRDRDRDRGRGRGERDRGDGDGSMWDQIKQDKRGSVRDEFGGGFMDRLENQMVKGHQQRTKQYQHQHPTQHQQPHGQGHFSTSHIHRLRDAFKRADRNGDGVVNKPEIVVQLQEDRELCELLGLPSDTSYDDPGFARMFREADVNNDRVLTFEEFVTICEKVKAMRAGGGGGQPSRGSSSSPRSRSNRVGSPKGGFFGGLGHSSRGPNDRDEDDEDDEDEDPNVKRMREIEREMERERDRQQNGYHATDDDGVDGYRVPKEGAEVIESSPRYMGLYGTHKRMVHARIEIPGPDPQRDVRGGLCYLTWEEANHGTLYITWSKDVVDGALAVFKPGPNAAPRPYKFVNNGGKSILQERATSEGGPYIKRYYEGWCLFAKEARKHDGLLTVAEGVPAALYVNFGNQQPAQGQTSYNGVQKVVTGRWLDVSKDTFLYDIGVASCHPHKNAFDVRTMEHQVFISRGRSEGAAMALGGANS